MGKGLLILITGTMTLLSILNLKIIERNQLANEEATNQFAEKQARLIAASMVNTSISKLSDDPGWRQTTPSQKTFFNGMATNRVVDTLLDGSEMIKITSDGNFHGTKKTITALVKAPNLIPPFLDYAIFGGEEVKLNGSNIKVKDANDPSLNSNVHSNDKVTFDGSNMTVEGFVTYKKSITTGGANIIPNNNPGGSPVHSKANVSIPSIDIGSYKNKADAVYNGDQTFTGTLNLESQSDPYIIYVKGKVFLKGKINGYGIIIAEDDVEMTSSFTNTESDPSHSKLLIVTQKKFILNNQNTTVHSSVYAKDEIVINAKNAVVEGNLISLKKVTLNNQNIEVNYKPLESNLSAQIFGQQTAVKRFEAAYWNE